MLEYIILGFLMNREWSGYQIKQHMGLSTAHFFDASFGSIYPALKRLEGRGHIAVRSEVENGKLKKLYNIKEAGRKEFMRWLESPIKLTKDCSGPLVKIFFYGFLPAEKSIENISLFLTEVEKAVGELEGIRPEVQKMAGPFEFATLEYGLAYYAFVKGFLGDLKKSIKLEGYS